MRAAHEISNQRRFGRGWSRAHDIDVALTTTGHHGRPAATRAVHMATVQQMTQ